MLSRVPFPVTADRASRRIMNAVGAARRDVRELLGRVHSAPTAPTLFPGQVLHDAARFSGLSRRAKRHALFQASASLASCCGTGGLTRLSPRSRSASPLGEAYHQSYSRTHRFPIARRDEAAVRPGYAPDDASGSDTMNSLPAPSPALRAMTLPPCMSTICFTTFSPIPRPPRE